MARIMGYDSPEDLISSVTNIGKQSYVNPDDRTMLLDIFSEHGKAFGFEVQFYRKDG